MKITVYILTADTARDGSFCHAFASDAERDAWAWENIVAKNLRSDETEDGSEECLDLVKDAFPTAHDAINEGERKGYDDSYWFFDNEIEIPSKKLTVYTIAADLENSGLETFAFASQQEREDWLWNEVVAHNLKTLGQTLQSVKAQFSSPVDAMLHGGYQREDDRYIMGTHEIEIPSQKIKLYTVQGEHFSNPGHIMKHFTDKQAATAEAVDLVNIMLADTGWQKLASPLQWEHHLTRLQDEHGAQYCDVWIEETEIEVPEE